VDIFVYLFNVFGCFCYVFGGIFIGVLGVWIYGDRGFGDKMITKPVNYGLSYPYLFPHILFPITI
jgi:hypothetical protein